MNNGNRRLKGTIYCAVFYVKWIYGNRDSERYVMVCGKWVYYSGLRML